jgi:hypothetical protein
MVTGELAPPGPDPDEAMVADARSGLTTAQIVDRKLLALLGGGHPGLFVQAAYRPGDGRRMPGQ